MEYEVIQHYGVKGMHWGVITKKKNPNKERRRSANKAAAAFLNGDRRNFQKYSKGLSQREIDDGIVRSLKANKRLVKGVFTSYAAVWGALVPPVLGVANPALAAVTSISTAALVNKGVSKLYENEDYNRIISTGVLTERDRKELIGTNAGYRYFNIDDFNVNK